MVPDIAVSGPFPIGVGYPFGRSNHSDEAVHQFGSGNAKIEQRSLLGEGAGRGSGRCSTNTTWPTFNLRPARASVGSPAAIRCWPRKEAARETSCGKPTGSG